MMGELIETNGRGPIWVVLGPQDQELMPDSIIHVAKILGFTDTTWVGTQGARWSRGGEPPTRGTGPCEISPEVDEMLHAHFRVGEERPRVLNEVLAIFDRHFKPGESGSVEPGQELDRLAELLQILTGPGDDSGP